LPKSCRRLVPSPSYGQIKLFLICCKAIAKFKPVVSGQICTVINNNASSVLQAAPW
jgi:hypothetical protein